MKIAKMLIILSILLAICFDIQAKPEKDYVKEHCWGAIEYTLPDRTRIDCLTATHAYEFDFAYKWAESIGQCLHYARMTDRLPGVYIIYRTQKEFRLHSNKIRDNITHYKALDIELIEILDF